MTRSYVVSHTDDSLKNTQHKRQIISINKLLLISKLTATYRAMALLTTEDPTLAFRNQPKRQDVFDFTENIDPKPKKFFFFLSVLTVNRCRLSGELLSCETSKCCSFKIK